MDESMRICPVDQENMHEDGTPHLVDTGQVQGPYTEQKDAVNKVTYVVLSYDTPYAVAQHEIQEYHHNAPEQWKYLEQPMNQRLPFLAANLVKGVNLERLAAEGWAVNGQYGYQAESQQSINEKVAILNADKARQRAITQANTKYGQEMGRYRL